MFKLNFQFWRGSKLLFQLSLIDNWKRGMAELVAAYIP
jgi:hypothetical protein